jgi:hypothetical protein
MDISILTNRELSNLAKEIETELKKRAGDTKFLDSLTGYYFRASKDDVYKTMSTLRQRCFNDCTLSLSEYCNAFNLPMSCIANSLVWDIKDNPFSPDFVPVTSDDINADMMIQFDYMPATDHGFC